MGERAHRGWGGCWGTVSEKGEGLRGREERDSK